MRSRNFCIGCYLSKAVISRCLKYGCSIAKIEFSITIPEAKANIAGRFSLLLAIINDKIDNMLTKLESRCIS